MEDIWRLFTTTLTRQPSDSATAVDTSDPDLWDSSLPTCRALSFPPGKRTSKHKCCCPTDVDILIRGLVGSKLPNHFIVFLTVYCEMSVPELLKKIELARATPIDNTGCKNRLLLQLRQIYLMEFETVKPQIHAVPICMSHIRNMILQPCRCLLPRNQIYGLNLILPESAVLELMSYVNAKNKDLVITLHQRRPYIIPKDLRVCKNYLILRLRQKLFEENIWPGKDYELSGLINFDEVDEQASSNFQLRTRSAEPDSRVSAIQNLPTCDSIFDDEHYVNRNDCNCPTDSAVLVSELDEVMSQDSIALLKKCCRMSKNEILDQILTFGDPNEQLLLSGCRNKLLIQLREIFLSQNKILNGLSTPGPSSSDRSETPASSASDSTPSTSSQSVESLKETIESLALENDTQSKLLQSMLESAEKHEESITCCVCLDEKRSVAFVPCGHVSCCRECASQLSACAICRTQITLKLDLLYS